MRYYTTTVLDLAPLPDLNHFLYEIEEKCKNSKDMTLVTEFDKVALVVEKRDGDYYVRGV